MADRSAIEWTDATWNPLVGCSKVSPGCAHCYAETFWLTRGKGKPDFTGLPWTPANAVANVKLRPDRLDQPLRWRAPRRIFVNSMSDLFHEQVPDDFIERVFDTMRDAPQHTFQVLTKRPDRMREFLLDYYDCDHGGSPAGDCHWCQPHPNIWLGTSVENQTWADRRIPELLETPAAVRFLSCEPLLGPLRLDALADHDGRFDAERPGWYDSLGGRSYDSRGDFGCRGPRIDWVIVGGESGQDHRPVDPAWVRSVRDQCVAAGVPFHFKQWGGRTPKSGGRELDGRTWDEYPA